MGKAKIQAKALTRLLPPIRLLCLQQTRPMLLALCLWMVQSSKFASLYAFSL